MICCLWRSRQIAARVASEGCWFEEVLSWIFLEEHLCDGEQFLACTTFADLVPEKLLFRSENRIVKFFLLFMKDLSVNNQHKGN